jgi:hypothetical protein
MNLEIHSLLVLSKWFQHMTEAPASPMAVFLLRFSDPPDLKNSSPRRVETHFILSISSSSTHRFQDLKSNRGLRLPHIETSLKHIEIILRNRQGAGRELNSPLSALRRSRYDRSKRRS